MRAVDGKPGHGLFILAAHPPPVSQISHELPMIGRVGRSRRAGHTPGIKPGATIADLNDHHRLVGVDAHPDTIAGSEP